MGGPKAGTCRDHGRTGPIHKAIKAGHGVFSELVTCFSRKTLFGYKFVAWASIAIAAIGFFVWDTTCLSAANRCSLALCSKAEVNSRYVQSLISRWPLLAVEIHDITVAARRRHPKPRDCSLKERDARVCESEKLRRWPRFRNDLD
jgi:hypothetical protein